MPQISLPETTVDEDCEHVYPSDNICVMEPRLWSSTFLMAFMVGRAAIWLNNMTYGGEMESNDGLERTLIENNNYLDFDRISYLLNPDIFNLNELQ